MERRRLAPLLVLLLLAQPLAGCVGGGGGGVDAADADPGEAPEPVDLGPRPEGTAGDRAEDGSGGFSMTHVFEGDYDTSGNHSRVLEPGPYEVGTTEVVTLESPVDGGDVEVGLVRPDVPEGQVTPVIAKISLYYYEALDGADLEAHARFLVDNYVEHGYTVALVAPRGTADNAGCMAFGGPAERADIDRALTYLGEANWSNGNVAATGFSYGGYASWEAAATGNPHLETVVPAGGPADWFRYFYPNGTTRVQSTGELVAFGYLIGMGGDNQSRRHAVESAACPEVGQGLAASGWSSATGERDPTGYWAARNVRPLVESNYNGSALVSQGLDDHNVRPQNVHPWWQQLRDQGIPVKLLLGQWGHSWPDRDQFPSGQEVRWDWAEILLHWFDYWLKGDHDRDLGPPVQVEDDRGRWHSVRTWPPPASEPRDLHLTSGGNLSRDGSGEAATYVVGPDPGRTADHDGQAQQELRDRCRTCASFTTGALEQSRHLSGAPKVHVTVTPTGTGGHLTAYLLDRGPEEDRIVGWGQIDLRHADADGEMEPVVPGQKLEVKLQLDPLDAHVPAGHELVLVLSQGTDDGALPSPSYLYGLEGVETSATPPTGMILHVGDGQSTMTARTGAPPTEAFFEPPGE